MKTGEKTMSRDKKSVVVESTYIKGELKKDYTF